MPQIFPRPMNVISRITMLGAILLLALLLWAGLIYTRSSYGTGMGVARVQPIPSSHEHHAGVLGIDCRYCHDTVERSSFANFPPTNRTQSLRELVQAMDRGRVDLLLILGGNPAYNAPADIPFAENLKTLAARKEALVMRHGLYLDETSFLCQWHLPEAHYLEAWSDTAADSLATSARHTLCRAAGLARGFGNRCFLERLSSICVGPWRRMRYRRPCRLAFPGICDRLHGFRSFFQGG